MIVLVTSGIRTSCKCKRFLYPLTKISDDVNLKNYYIKHCKILTTVIKDAKCHMYNSRISNSNSKMKTTWNIIKMETNRLKGGINTAPINYQNSPEAFTRYFLSTPKNIIEGIRSKTN